MDNPKPNVWNAKSFFISKKTWIKTKWRKLEEKGWGRGVGWSSRESNNDGSDQSTTCQTLEVISCFIEDFYGILAAHPTSQWGRRNGEREFSLPLTHTHTLSLSPALFLLQPTPLPEPSGSRWNRVPLPQCEQQHHQWSDYSVFLCKGKPRIKPNLITKVNTTSRIV